MTIPQTIPPIACTVLCAAVLMILVLRHVSLDLVDQRTHSAAHQAANAAVIADAATHCPAGTRITIFENGKKICITEGKRTLRGVK